MVRAFRTFLTALYMRASSETGHTMVMVAIYTTMEIGMRVAGRNLYAMVKVRNTGKTAAYILVNGLKINDTVRES